MAELTNELVGRSTGQRTFEYTWRDIALYALGVGAKEDELNYLYEEQLQAVPTFGVVPYWGTFGITPYFKIPQNAVRGLGIDLTGSLHMTHELVLHKPIDPMGGKLTFEDKITNVYDRDGKGAVIRTELTAVDLQGEKVFTNIGQIYCKRHTAPGCETFPKTDVEIPDREPDFCAQDYLPGHQSLLYRLSGDTNRTHVDYDYAVSLGHPRQLVQGLCTFGYAGRMSVGQLFPKQPERMKRIGAQIRNAMYPGTNIELQLWKVSETKAYFRLVNMETGKPALDKGFVEWE